MAKKKLETPSSRIYQATINSEMVINVAKNLAEKLPDSEYKEFALDHIARLESSIIELRKISCWLNGVDCDEE